MSDIRRDVSSEPVDRTEPVDDRTQQVDDRAAALTGDDRAPAGEHAAGAGDQRRIDRDPSSEHVTPEHSGRTEADAPGGAAGASNSLLADDDRTTYQRRWDDIQVQFIDEPRQSVRQADDLVSEVTREIAERFSAFRRDFEQRWEGGDEPTTEELRRALQRYRDFFQRLVSH